MLQASKILFIFTFFSSLFSLRPPATPLIVHDPYISIWSFTDNLTDDFPRHWTGGVTALVGMLNIDGSCFRFMGPADMSGSVCPQKMAQVSLTVRATYTLYEFEEGVSKTRLRLMFATPADLQNLELLSSSISYISYEITNEDIKAHDVDIYFDNSAEITVTSANEQVVWESGQFNSMGFLKIGTHDQVFNQGSNNDRIDWGFWYIAFQTQADLVSTVSDDVSCRGLFAQKKDLPTFDTNMPREAGDKWPVLAIRKRFLQIKPSETKQFLLTVGYDDNVSMEYFGHSFKPLFSKDTPNYQDHLFNYLNRFNELKPIILALSDQISSELQNSSGGNNYKYAEIGSLAYRQLTGSLKIVYNDVLNITWAFMKEISSDGDVSTVDVIYPASPLILFKNLDLFVMILHPILSYANNETQKYGNFIPYNLPWAPHHLGVWPTCNIRPDQQEQMPIEETANLLLLIAYIMENKADTLEFFTQYQNLLQTWGDYLVQNLPDPGDQLCTDDFEGPSPHNVNLAAKGILGIGAYGKILGVFGDAVKARFYEDKAKEYYTYWNSNALAQDHYKLQFNLGNDTWSQKYNLIFQLLLGLDIFPSDVLTKEIDFYLTKMNKYGFPLDNRAGFTKVDWSFWSGSLGTDEQFLKVIDATYKFLNETTSRVPFTDWYRTDNAQMQGFQARPVVGGLWSKVLIEKKLNSLRRTEREAFSFLQ